MTVSDTWSGVAFPILHWIGGHEGLDPVDVRTLVDALGVDAVIVAIELQRLVDGGYLAGEFRKLSSGGEPELWYLIPTQLSERGARVVGLWPSGDAGDVLLDVLERAEETEPDAVQRSLLAEARDALATLTKERVTELALSVVKGTAGLP